MSLYVNHCIDFSCKNTQVVQRSRLLPKLLLSRRAMGWKSESKRAKRLHRPSLDDWGCDGFDKSFPEFASNILRRNNSVDHFNPFGRQNKYRSIPAILDARTLSIEEFHERFEANGIPCIIKNIPEGTEGSSASRANSVLEEKKENDTHPHSKDKTCTKRWPALDNWTLDSLKKDQELRHCKLKCGEDDDGYSIRLKLKHFLKYMKYNSDDSPLYIFDSTFDDDEKARKLLGRFHFILCIPIHFQIFRSYTIINHG